ncbi:hypothetical protein ACI2IX_14565 [Leifsonia aquatica]|uniref:hypothetical protein n=1 Tax=Leifsonia aquatica TaxID=144185 RepID=UPI00384E847D
MTTPGNETPPIGSAKTRDQLLDETLAQTDELVRLIGGEWLDLGVPPRTFDASNRTGWAMASCDVSAALSQYRIHVRQRVEQETGFEPDVVTERVREHWRSSGYDVKQIGPAPTDEHRLRSIDVALPHNAGLSFDASTQSMGIIVYSECIPWD